jgi:hypothetical protein
VVQPHFIELNRKRRLPSQNRKLLVVLVSHFYGTFDWLLNAFSDTSLTLIAYGVIRESFSILIRIRDSIYSSPLGRFTCLPSTAWTAAIQAWYLWTFHLSLFHPFTPWSKC